MSNDAFVDFDEYINRLKQVLNDEELAKLFDREKSSSDLGLLGLALTVVNTYTAFHHAEAHAREEATRQILMEHQLATSEEGVDIMRDFKEDLGDHHL